MDYLWYDQENYEHKSKQKLCNKKEHPFQNITRDWD